VLSIARQESRFQADAKSVAAARGMMQFIASTANEIATQVKLRQFQSGRSLQPDTAILFGSQYLANLFQAVSQSAAGSGRFVQRRRRQSGALDRALAIANEADRYVPEIGFTQTKDYVYKVMANFWTYQRLYDAQLQPTNEATKNDKKVSAVLVLLCLWRRVLRVVPAKW
jgi:soluble lytic murein transglycosylase